jgi:RNA polymerase sigma-70 factor, ECF subfamily
MVWMIGGYCMVGSCRSLCVALGYLDCAAKCELIAGEPMISGCPDRPSWVDTTAETSAELLDRAKGGDERAFGELVEPHRHELRAHCYRMLGSVQDAEDAVQDALLRAWRGLPRFENRSTLRSWLYSIATNTALDVARNRSRRELPVDFGPPGAPGALVDPPVTDPVWLEPCPDSWLPAMPAAPEARYEQRESVELAFMVMLQRLPPLQRAVLILRDVLGFPAADVSAQLGTSVPAVNSALQRARAAARTSLPSASQQAQLRALGPRRAERLARRYADALEAGDADALLGMLTADAAWSMPPIPTWFRGHEALRQWLIRDPLSVRWRHRHTQANGQLAVGCYVYSDDAGDFLPTVIDVLTLSGEQIAAVTAFIVADEPDPAGIFASFGLPARVA